MAKKKYRTIGGKKFELVPTEEESDGSGCGCLLIIIAAALVVLFLL